ncbi:hypothetical protein LOAG_02755 [Loa loa]|uniref:Gnk2-homologous domain-containing protein n=1 Tax=Loa loa TaxID=7209 RepID=A0A1I7V7F7_LOALO|nr:hypothetical protein LOAG_02755 [Loa loa]EFO25728.1 hypothetical protein LOAG_02755 [Loa loa]
MHSIWNTAITVLFLFVTAERSDAALKNRTGEGHFYWGQPFGIPQWPRQGWVQPQNWMQPQGGISSQGWALPPGWVPSSAQPTPSPFLWNLFDDRNVCTLDASILVVLDNDRPTAPAGLDINGQSPSSYYGGDLSSNAVRMACSNIATTSAQACTACCKMACKHYTISVGDVYGFLINSTRLTAGQFPDITLPAFQGMQHQGSIPPQTLPPLPPVSCVCCGPRRYFTSWPSSAPNPPPQQM